MTPSLVYLIGFPAAGKYTIARELSRVMAEREQRMVVVDNHHINNVVFAVIDTDGKRSLPLEVWERVSEVRRAVLAAIRDIAPRDWSYVFTNVLIAGLPDDESAPDELAALAEARGSAFVPVVLRCSTEELEKRIVAAERHERLKWVDPVGLRDLVERSELVDVSRFEHTLEMDVTALPAREAARAIVDHLDRVSHV
jgi:tRNA uridine 5-carbamoylmethylation protein Kti12